MAERLLEKPPCDTCEEIFRKKGKEPDCKACIPEILPENQIILDLYRFVENQYIMGFDGPVAIDIAAIDIVMKRLEVTDRAVFTKLFDLCQHMLMFKRMKAK